MSGPYSATSAARTSGSPSVTSWPRRSASRIRAPSASSTRATVVLPLPARPIRPRMKTPSPASARRTLVDIEPRRPQPGAGLERNPEFEAALHLDAYQLGHRFGLPRGALQQQLVVDLQQQSSRRP